MKKELFLETKPVRYSEAGIKTLSFEMGGGDKCFIPHWHDRIELIRVKSGRMSVELGSEGYELCQDMLMIVPPKKMHKGYALTEGVKYDIAMFDLRSFYNEAELCKNMLSAIFDGVAIFNAVTADKDILVCFDRIFESNKHASLCTVASVYELISLLYERELVLLKERTEKAFVQRVIEYFDEKAGEEISVFSLAEKFGYTAAHFCRKFKEATGLSPMSYLKIYRLDMASRDIKQTDLPICEIAQRYGFDDANYFTRCFRARYELSPTKYRRINKSR